VTAHANADAPLGLSTTNPAKLGYYEAFPDAESAIAREKQLKNWNRAKKESLIDSANPRWRDVLDAMHA